MDRPSGAQGATFVRLCTPKSISKCFLIVYSAATLLLLIYTAFSRDPISQDERTWWWGFLASLVISATVSISALLLLIYTDYYVVIDETTDPEAANNPDPDDPNSAINAVMTINSTPLTNKSASGQAEKEPAVMVKVLPEQSQVEGPPPPPLFFPPQNPAASEGLQSFADLTPAPKSPVTFVDMKKKKKKKSGRRNPNEPDNEKEISDAANFAAIPSTVLARNSKEKTARTKKAKVKKKH